jgi:hypothetical protein
MTNQNDQVIFSQPAGIFSNDNALDNLKNSIDKATKFSVTDLLNLMITYLIEAVFNSSSYR